jgi:hypothetical protein
VIGCIPAKQTKQGKKGACRGRVSPGDFLPTIPLLSRDVRPALAP